MEYAIHEVMAESAQFRLVWVDEARSISLLHVRDAWDWPDAHRCLRLLSDQQARYSHPLYTIFCYEPGAALLPREPGVISQIRQLMDYDRPNKRMLIFVGQHSILSNFVTVTGRIYSLSHLLGKFCYVDSLEVAFELIAHDKARETPS